MSSAKKEYNNVIYLNFAQNPEYSSVFAGSLDVEDLVMQISALKVGSAKFEAAHTVFAFDEIQDCPQVRTSLKFFCKDERYDVICVGSSLETKECIEKPTSMPVGSETVIEMFPLDFEEFLWANWISDGIVDILKEKLET